MMMRDHPWKLGRGRGTETGGLEGGGNDGWCSPTDGLCLCACAPFHAMCTKLPKDPSVFGRDEVLGDGRDVSAHLRRLIMQQPFPITSWPTPSGDGREGVDGPWMDKPSILVHHLHASPTLPPISSIATKAD